MRKFLKPLLIGELAPEEPSQDGAQNVREHLGALGALPVASSSYSASLLWDAGWGLGLGPLWGHIKRGSHSHVLYK